MEFEHPQIESARIMLENAGYTVTKKSELPLGYYKCSTCNGIFSSIHYCAGSSANKNPISYLGASHKEELFLR